MQGSLDEMEWRWDAYLELDLSRGSSESPCSQSYTFASSVLSPIPAPTLTANRIGAGANAPSETVCVPKAGRCGRTCSCGGRACEAQFERRRRPRLASRVHHHHGRRRSSRRRRCCQSRHIIPIGVGIANVAGITDTADTASVINVCPAPGLRIVAKCRRGLMCW